MPILRKKRADDTSPMTQRIGTIALGQDGQLPDVSNKSLMVYRTNHASKRAWLDPSQQIRIGRKVRIAADKTANNSSSALKLAKPAKQEKYLSVGIRTADQPNILYKKNNLTKEERDREGKKYLTHTRIIANPDFSAVGGNPFTENSSAMTQTLNS